MARVLAVLEQRAGKVRRVSLEVLTAARVVADATGSQVDALLIGAAGMGELASFGADKVFTISDDALALYQPAAYAAAAVERAKVGGYGAIVLGATALGRDLGPRIAARLAVPLLADATEIQYDGGIIVSRPAYSGKAIYRLKVTAPSCVISVRPNVFTPKESRKTGTPAATPAPSVGEDPRQRTVRVKEPERASLDVAEAAVVVSGGRGLREPAGFKILEDLAAAFGNAAVGASRAVVDAGWRPHGEQVGQTGKTVSPSLYIAIGISGAIQHLAGMRTARVIVAINKDKDAPIFKVADYGIVGDLFEIVPKLTEEIRRLRSS
jgi:electron transfer flavoprotein alpha subunit